MIKQDVSLLTIYFINTVKYKKNKIFIKARFIQTTITLVKNRTF